MRVYRAALCAWVCVSVCACGCVCVLARVCVCVCVSGAISKEVLLQLTQALANRRERQNALYLPRMHMHKATEEGRAQQGVGGKHTK